MYAAAAVAATCSINLNVASNLLFCIYTNVQYAWIDRY